MSKRKQFFKLCVALFNLQLEMLNSYLQLVKNRAISDNINRHDDVSWSMEMLVTKKDTNILKLRKQVFGVLTDISYNRFSKILAYFMSVVIVGSVLEFALETVRDLNSTPEQVALFHGFELFFNIAFSIDYFTKILSCPNYARLPKFLVSPSWIIDLLSILPFYIELILASSSSASILRIVRIVRIFRIFRLLKLSKNMKQVIMMFEALKKSKDAVIMLVILLLNSLIFFGAFIFFAELGDSQYDESGVLSYSATGNISGFQSIPHTMWFTIVTMTTVFFTYLGWIW